ncbi:MAG: type II secretion system F family protein [Beijerinckiaceae bacterium]
MDAIAEKLLDRQFMLSLLVAIATIATILTLAMPLLQTDSLSRRMKSVASERERIRIREREKLFDGKNKVSLRQEPKAYMKDIVERFSLSKWLGTDKAKMQMTMAGFRGPQAEVAFLFFRLVTPIALFLFALVYVFLLSNLDWPLPIECGVAIGAAYIGIKAPEVFLSNKIAKRQKSMARVVPDAMDLLLICVESGMSIEPAFRKVAQEIGRQSIAMAEELTLTTAELSYLPDRRAAFENLGVRTGLDALKQIATVLVQSERYGTPLAQALRVVAQESRNKRMNDAEKKAAALPPKLTVPMIIFFLPVLFAVIITPAVIQVSGVAQ